MKLPNYSGKQLEMTIAARKPATITYYGLCDRTTPGLLCGKLHRHRPADGVFIVKSMDKMVRILNWGL